MRLALVLTVAWALFVGALYAAMANASPGSDFAAHWKSDYNAAAARKGVPVHTDRIVCADPVKRLYKCRIAATDLRPGTPRKHFCVLAVIRPNGSIPKGGGHVVSCQKSGVA